MKPFKEIPRFPAGFDMDGNFIAQELPLVGMPTEETSIFSDAVTVDIAQQLGYFLAAKNPQDRLDRIGLINIFCESPNLARATHAYARSLLQTVRVKERREAYLAFFSTFDPQAKDIRSPEEQSISETNKLSGTSYKDIFGYYDLATLLEGQSVVDLGAGFSDVTASLVERGIDAYAVDPYYISQPKLFYLANGILNRPLHVDKKDRATFDRFRASMRKAPERYIPASASQIPLPDNFCDRVISSYCMLSYLDKDYHVLENSVSEAIRVTKPGGKVAMLPSLFPYARRDPEEEQARLQNEVRLHSWLRVNPTVRSYQEAVNGSQINRLVIEKLS